MSKSIPFPPPYKGQNSQIPLAVLRSPYCERLINFKTLFGKTQVRNGSSAFAVALAAINTIPIGLFSYESSTNPIMVLVTLSAGNQASYYDIDTAGTVTARAVNTAAGAINPPIQASYFRNYLFFYGDGSLAAGAGGPNAFSGTWINPMPVSSYTWPASFNPLVGTVHKNRQYAVGKSSRSYAYSGINAISGAMTEVNLSDVISSECELFLIKSLSTSNSTNIQNVAAFIFNNGDILIYDGSYPDSPTWNLVSRFKVSDLFYATSFIDAKGDTFLFTNSEVLSLRNLFINGYDVERTTGIGAAIQPRWAQIVVSYLSGAIDYRKYMKGIYDSKRDRMVMVLPVWVDPDTGVIDDTKCGFLIYDFIMGAWYEYKQTIGTAQLISSTYFRGDVYFLMYAGSVPYINKLEGKTSFLDDISVSSTTAIDYDLITAPLDISKFGTNAIDGIETISKSDMYPETSVSVIGDLGRVETSGQPLPTQSSDIRKPMYNVGINDATFSQIRISGSTTSGKSIGYELYAFNVWYNQGQEGSR